MDFTKAQPPSSTSGSGSTSSSSSSNADDGDAEAGRINEPFGLVSNTFKDLYDYIALETGNSGLFSDASLFSLTNDNDTFLEINANLASAGLSAANGTALTLLQSNLTAGVVSLAAAAATIAAAGNGTASSSAATNGGGVGADVLAKGLQDTLGGATGSEDDFSDVLITTVTSIILGLMILITVIGECKSSVYGSHLRPRFSAVKPHLFPWRGRFYALAMPGTCQP